LQAGTGIAELIALEMSKQTGSLIEECRPKIWLMDSKGLIVASRIDSLQAFKKPWAHEHEPVATLLEAVQSLKPTVLIGTSGKGCMYTPHISQLPVRMRAMAGAAAGAKERKRVNYYYRQTTE